MEVNIWELLRTACVASIYGFGTQSIIREFGAECRALFHILFFLVLQISISIQSM